MCKPISFVVTQDRLIATFGDDSHTDQLISAGIKDDKLEPDFVKVEYIVPANPSLKDVENWLFVVDQDYVPDWFVESEWRGKIVDYIRENSIAEDTEIACGQYLFIEAKVGKLFGQYRWLCSSGTVTYNRGTVTCNHGTVTYNHGTVTYNSGTMTCNCSGGTVTYNRGTVTCNHGTVANNHGTVTYNSGTMTCNCSGGTVTYNYGTVTCNYGRVTDNHGKDGE